MKHARLRVGWLLLTVAAAMPLAHASGWQGLASLQHVAEDAVRKAAPADARVVVRAGALDSRLRLQACAELEAEPPAIRGYSTRLAVTVHCAQGAPWSVRVPVDVQIYRKVLVTERALARGDMPAAADVRAVERDVARLGYGYLTDPSELAGRSMARPVRQGTVLTPGMLAHREAVRRGDQVALTVDAGGIRVRADGVAMAGGDVGERVQVRSSSSGRLIDGIVRGAGQVEALP